MKILFLFLLVFCNGFIASAKSPFSVKLELRNPSGKVDIGSYFLFTLTNNSDSSYIFSRGVYLSAGARTVEHTYLVREMQLLSEIDKGSRTQSFDFETKKALIVKPCESVSIKIPLFTDDFGFGALPLIKETLVKVKKIRYTLTKLRYINKDNPFVGFKFVDLVSNWVDIDGAACVHLL